MGVALEIRPQLLLAETAEERTQIALDAIWNSIQHMQGSDRFEQRPGYWARELEDTVLQWREEVGRKYGICRYFYIVYKRIWMRMREFCPDSVDLKSGKDAGGKRTSLLFDEFEQRSMNVFTFVRQGYEQQWVVSKVFLGLLIFLFRVINWSTGQYHYLSYVGS